jgi:hypothetical protein
MYEVDSNDRVVELKNVPQPSVGAPNPVVLASEYEVLLAYYLQHTPEGWDGKTPRSVGLDSKDEPVALIKLRQCYAHIFGPPNDEAFHGHPLYKRGLRPYAVFEVENSSWLRSLEKMNSVHPYHNREGFLRDKKHFVFAFHDSTFECIA